MCIKNAEKRMQEEGTNKNWRAVKRRLWGVNKKVHMKISQ